MENKTAFYLNQYNQQKDSIRVDLTKRLELANENEKIAEQLKSVVKQFDGKVYNKRLDNQLQAVCDQYNRDHQTQVSVATKKIVRRDSNSRGWALEIELRHYVQRYNWSDWVFFWLDVNLTTPDSGGRIEADTLVEPCGWNQTNKNELQKALDQIDTASDQLRQMLEAVEVFNAIPHRLRAKMQLPYICSHQ